MSLKSSLCKACLVFDRSGNSPYCKICRQLIDQAGNSGSRKRARIATSEAIIAIRESLELCQRLYGPNLGVLSCYYSHIPLNIDKLCSSHGDYASFDHTVPNVASRAVLCSRIVNDFKGLMTDDEFRRFVCEVLDVTAERRLHDLTVEETERYLSALKVILGKAKECSAARQQLKSLSSKIRFEKKEVETPGE
jgi:hypothetical protein